jgi:hypothetical protein
MKITYQNLTDENDPDNGREFSSTKDVIRLMTVITPSRRRPYSFDLLADNGRILTVGIEGEFGIAQYTVKAGGPFVMAVDQSTYHLGDLKFVVGGTLTPVSGRYRVPTTKIEHTVKAFVATGELTMQVEWEEFDPRVA